MYKEYLLFFKGSVLIKKNFIYQVFKVSKNRSKDSINHDFHKGTLNHVLGDWKNKA